MKRISVLLLIICLTTSCASSCDEPDDAVSVEWHSQGSGETNELPLMAARQGWRLSENVYAGEIDLGGGRRALRYVTPGYWPGVGYLSDGEEGMLLHGSSTEGVLERPVLMVPKTVRVGMKWTSSPGGDRPAYTFEVTERKELPTDVGVRPVWTIEMISESGLMRTRVYVEGVGFYGPGATFESIGTEDERLTDPLDSHLAPLEERAPSKEPQPSRAKLTPVDVFGDEHDYFWVHRVETRQTQDTSSQHKLHTRVVCNLGHGLRLCDAERLLYAEFEGSRVNEAGGTLPNLGWFDQGGTEHRLDDMPDGTPGVPLPVFYQRKEDAALVHLRYDINYGRNVWRPYAPDAQGSYQMYRSVRSGPLYYRYDLERTLAGSYRDPHTPNFLMRQATGLSWHWHLDDDQLLSGQIAGFVPEQIHTAISPGVSEHLIATQDGFVDRLVIEHDGVRRERLGAVDLPEGHVLTAIAPLNLTRPDRDPVYLAFTNVGRTYGLDIRSGAGLPRRHSEVGTTHVWTVTLGGQPQPMDNHRRTSIDVRWDEGDARVCWPPTDEELDLDGWQLGGVPALAVIPSGEHCATLIRDYVATPLADAQPSFGSKGQMIQQYMPFGWASVEGPIPGIGRTLLMQQKPTNDTRQTRDPKVDGRRGLLPDGQGNWVFNGPHYYRHAVGDGSDLLGGHRVDRFDAAGVYLGAAYFHGVAHRGPVLIDPVRGGLWRTYECGDHNAQSLIECDDDGWRIALVGNEGAERRSIRTPAPEGSLEETWALTLEHIFDDGRLLTSNGHSYFVVDPDADADSRIEELVFPTGEVDFEYNNRDYTYTLEPATFHRVLEDGRICGEQRMIVDQARTEGAHIFFCTDASRASFRYIAIVGRTILGGDWDLDTEGYVIVTEAIDASTIALLKLDLDTLELEPWGEYTEMARNDNPFDHMTRREDLENLPGPDTLFQTQDNQLFTVTAHGLERVEVVTDADWRAALELPDGDDSILSDHLRGVTDEVLILGGHHYRRTHDLVVRVPYESLEVVPTN